ncbi:Polysaccharide biosynthesis domain containing protein [Rhypophila sp. PSN 637]
MSVQQVPAGFNAEEADNFEDIEKQFAVKAVQHMTTYWAILEKVKGSSLRLTKLDDEIYEHLKTDFPEFDPAATIDEDEMKSKAGKERWRNFMMKYEKKVDDYNFGTMLRSNPKWEYGEKETIFGALRCLNGNDSELTSFAQQSQECSSMRSRLRGKFSARALVFAIDGYHSSG